MPDNGTFTNGMEYARWGDGPRTALWIPGGPGSGVPAGTSGAMMGMQFKALIEAGFTVWQVTRRRNMAAGHTVADMADDYAQLIKDQFGGRVEVVVGISYGGMIAQYLAANHPRRMARFVLALAAARVSDWGNDVDERWAMARAEGRMDDAGRVMAEYIFPEPSQQRVRALVGPVMQKAFAGDRIPPGDLMVEAHAEVAFDAREILPRIAVPVLIVAAEEDMFFPPALIDETAALIPDCTVLRYEGLGHLRAGSSSRLARDIADWVDGR